jgi:hypothetical protein
MMLYLFVVFSVIGFFHYANAFAQLSLHPDPGSSIPSDHYSYLQNCDSGSETPAFGSWVSPSGDASSGSMTVPAGSTSAGLQYNFDGAYCKDNSNSLETRSKIIGVSSGVTANSGGALAGNAVGLNWPGNGTGNAGYYAGTSFPFKYTPSGGFRSGTNTYTLSLTFATINRFNTGKYICVANENGGANDAGGGFNYDRCASYTRSFSISVTVPPPPSNTPSGRLTCTATTTTLSLHYDYMNTPSGADVTRDGTSSPGATFLKVDSAATDSGDVDGGAVSQGITYSYFLLQRGTNPATVLDSTSCSLVNNTNPPPPPPPPPPSSGPLTCSSSTTNSITVHYKISDSYSINNYIIGPSGTSGLPNGPGESDVTQSGLTESTPYSFTLYVSGNNTASVTCSTNAPAYTPPPPPPPPPPATGTGDVSCGASTSTTLVANYRYYNTANGTTVYYMDMDSSPRSLTTAGYNSTPGSQSGQYTISGLVTGHRYGLSMQDNTSGEFIVPYTDPIICNPPPPPVPFTVTGSAGVTLNDDEAPTSYSSNYTNDGDHYTITPDSSTGGSVAISCSISITKNGNPLGTATDCSGTSPANSTPVAVTGPSGSDTGVAGDKYCSFITLSPSKGTINADGTVTPTAPAVTTPGNCATVANKPYFKVYNSSVATGGQVGACLSDPGALASWYNNAGGNNYGSSAQLGAYALAHITGFASNQTGSRPPDGLSFANTTGTAADKNSPPLGGQFGGRNCITSPAEPPLSGTTVNAAGGYYPPVNLASIFGGSPSSQAYSYGSASTPAQVELQIGGSKLRAGHSVGIYVAGDVYISDDIVYDQSRWGVDGVPSFVLSVKGNIYIAPGVKNLMGTYEAQKNGASGGNIYTCASAAFRPSTSANRLYATCGTQLTVTGSFVADKLNLQRTFGTLHNETGGPCSNSNGGANASPNNHNTCAAEVFEFSPSQYLEKPAARPSGNGAQQYDAIVSLPPVL